MPLKKPRLAPEENGFVEDFGIDIDPDDFLLNWNGLESHEIDQVVENATKMPVFVSAGPFLSSSIPASKKPPSPEYNGISLNGHCSVETVEDSMKVERETKPAIVSARSLSTSALMSAAKAPTETRRKSSETSRESKTKKKQDMMKEATSFIPSRLLLPSDERAPTTVLHYEGPRGKKVQSQPKVNPKIIAENIKLNGFLLQTQERKPAITAPGFVSSRTLLTSSKVKNKSDSKLEAVSQKVNPSHISTNTPKTETKPWTAAILESSLKKKPSATVKPSVAVKPSTTLKPFPVELKPAAVAIKPETSHPSVIVKVEPTECLPSVSCVLEQAINESAIASDCEPLTQETVSKILESTYALESGLVAHVSVVTQHPARSVPILLDSHQSVLSVPALVGAQQPTTRAEEGRVIKVKSHSAKKSRSSSSKATYVHDLKDTAGLVVKYLSPYLKSGKVPSKVC